MIGYTVSAVQISANRRTAFLLAQALLLIVFGSRTYFRSRRIRFRRLIGRLGDERYTRYVGPWRSRLKACPQIVSKLPMQHVTCILAPSVLGIT
jgi:hypothetical protein